MHREHLQLVDVLEGGAYTMPRVSAAQVDGADAGISWNKGPAQWLAQGLFFGDWGAWQAFLDRELRDGIQITELGSRIYTHWTACVRVAGAFDPPAYKKLGLHAPPADLVNKARKLNGATVAFLAQIAAPGFPGRIELHSLDASGKDETHSEGPYGPAMSGSWPYSARGCGNRMVSGGLWPYWATWFRTLDELLGIALAADGCAIGGPTPTIRDEDGWWMAVPCYVANTRQVTKAGILNPPPEVWGLTKADRDGVEDFIRSNGKLGAGVLQRLASDVPVGGLYRVWRGDGVVVSAADVISGNKAGTCLEFWDYAGAVHRAYSPTIRRGVSATHAQAVLNGRMWTLTGDAVWVVPAVGPEVDGEARDYASTWGRSGLKVMADDPPQPPPPPPPGPPGPPDSPPVPPPGTPCCIHIAAAIDALAQPSPRWRRLVANRVDQMRVTCPGGAASIHLTKIEEELAKAAPSVGVVRNRLDQLRKVCGC